MPHNEKGSGQKFPLVVINSHPIQYFAPLYKYCAAKELELEVWYCSDESIRGSRDMQFGTEVKWDIPLLEGYNYRFFKNYSWQPSIFRGFWGLINVGILFALMRKRKSVVLINGWNYFTTASSIVIGKLAGHKVFMRAESPLNQEPVQPMKKWLKRIFLKQFLFRLIDGFLFIGKQNKAFYRNYGVGNDRLFFAPYAVDNERFQRAAIGYSKNRNQLCNELGIDPGSFVVLFSAKYIEKKRPMDLLKAFRLVDNPNAILVMVGEGELHAQMKSFIRENSMNNVVLTGFVNQSQIAKYYAVAHCFVMCSGVGETWGLSVNEAMNFSLPVIISDTPGSAADLVEPGRNGFIFNTGNIHQLSEALNRFINMNEEERKKMGEQSFQIVNNYSYTQIADTLKRVCQ